MLTKTVTALTLAAGLLVSGSAFACPLHRASAGKAAPAQKVAMASSTQGRSGKKAVKSSKRPTSATPVTAAAPAPMAPSASSK